MHYFVPSQTRGAVAARGQISRAIAALLATTALVASPAGYCLPRPDWRIDRWLVPAAGGRGLGGSIRSGSVGKDSIAATGNSAGESSGGGAGSARRSNGGRRVSVVLAGMVLGRLAKTATISAEAEVAVRMVIRGRRF